MFLFDVTRDFQKCLKHLFTENVPFLQHMQRMGVTSEEAVLLADNHENRPVVLRNMCEQVQLYEAKFKGKVNARERAMIIAAGAEMFAKAIIEKKRQDNLTGAEKGRILSLDSKRKEVASLMKEVPRNVQEEN